MVVGYNNGIGILLFPRDSFTLREAMKQFLTSQKDDQFWLARFRRSDVPKEDRDCLEAEHQNKNKARNGAVIPLSDVFCGRRFICDLEKADQWETSSLRLQVHLGQTLIPHDRRKQIE